MAATWRWRRNAASDIDAAASILPTSSSPTRPMSIDNEPDGFGTKSMAPNSRASKVIWAFSVVRLDSITTRVGVSSIRPIGEERARERKALGLPAREPPPPLAHGRVEAAGQQADELAGAGR